MDPTFLSSLFSHLPISSYTDISLEARILLFQMTDSQSAWFAGSQQKGFLLSKLYFFPSLLLEKPVSK